MSADPALSQPIPRGSLTWLMVAQALVIVPFITHVPWSILVLWLVCTLWRIQISRMRVRIPGTWIKSGLLVGTAGGVYLARGSLVGLDAGAALLIAAFVLKMLEMQTRRDALVLIFLGFFCVVVGYLFEDNLLWAAFTLLPVSTLLAALIGLQQTDTPAKPAGSFKLALALLLQAVPLMLVLFLFFPRLEPLWSLPQPGNKALTGLSDSMAPGDIAQLSKSAALVFRASFEGAIPARNQLYWRSLTLEQFDGRRWSQAARAQTVQLAQWQKQGDALRYSIVMEPSGRPWLSTLDVGQTDLPDVRQMSDFRLQRRRPVEQSLLYSVSSWPEAIRDGQFSENIQRQDVQLPPKGNPQARQWANDLLRNHPRPDALVDAVLAYFRTESFHYTLKPPTLGPENIDSFLFDSRRGFCAHYAGAMTFVLRAAGIPARVVAGYQGGELNPEGNYLTVRQFDAHAWVEYWQPGSGWRSVDPTAAVAPQRIEQGLEQALAADEVFLDDSPMSALRYRNVPWINALRLSWDNLNYGWQRWVLGYQGQQQLQVLDRWFSGLQAPAFIGAAGAALVVIALWIFKPWQRESDSQLRVFNAFERLLARRGLRRLPGEGVEAFARRAGLFFPEQAEWIDAFTEEFQAQRYAGRRASSAQLRRRLKQLRRRLPWRLSAAKGINQ
ncbi:transglutaminaseTgpA domain-containing protein [Pseudomonas sp. DWP3-1-2]|uniref:transglutaminase family protein n=1 Tax=Pseudomonas sp. DWP3-1-2 TaxID=2804645 RepID=UPI003CEC21B5